MSEKKTFKNPRLTSYVDKVWVGWGEPYALDQGTVEFPKDEWDWEVTFTKKVKPFAIGDVIKYDKFPSDRTATIQAIDGNQCWLKFSDGSHVTWELDDVRR